MKYFSFHPAVYPNMLRAVSPDAGPGDLVHVMDKEGQLFGSGFFNPNARVPLRVLQHGEEPLTEEKLDARLDAALDLRLNTLRLNDTTDAWRAVHSDGDGLSGLVVDRYADVLSIEVTTLGIWRRLRRWLPRLHEKLGTKQHVIQTDPDIARIEAMRWADVPEADDPAPRSIRIRENGVRYQVNFEDGHKTGFFCDQRDNRFSFAGLARGDVLDACCYTGGFSLNVLQHGEPRSVTAVDLDEQAVEAARGHAKLNQHQARLKLVHADVFDWMRQVHAAERRFDSIVLDPPKFIADRTLVEKGEAKYHDLNRLALKLLRPGGLLLTCSCSGLLPAARLVELVRTAARKEGRDASLLAVSGAAPDHPVGLECPETEYLKALWLRVW